MNWIAPSEKDTASVTLEKRLWDTADQFRANSGLKAQEYSGPILRITFLRSRTLTPEFVFCLARSEEFRGGGIKSMSGATGRQRVQERCFDGFQIAQPPRALLDQFSTIVAPSFRLIYNLHLQIQNLRRTRDLLLPRLLSGQAVSLDI